MRKYLFSVLFLSYLGAQTAAGITPSSGTTEISPSLGTQETSLSNLVGGDLALSYDYFRSLPEGTWTGNTGAYVSVNLATSIPKGDMGFGAQLGGSFGLYDWSGRGLSGTNQSSLEQQAIITAGLYRVTSLDSGVNAGLVYDLMINTAYGVFALNPTLGQLRAQVGYQMKSENELGFWGALGVQTAYKSIDDLPVKFRSIAQANLYWTHYYQNKGQTMIWIGFPCSTSLYFPSGPAGQFLCGVRFSAPLSNRLSIIGHGSYMAPHWGTIADTASSYGANITFALNYSFGNSESVYRPYMPIADNSNFIVDTSANN